MHIEVSLFDLRTVFCKFNCSLACVRNTVNGVSLGFLHSPGFSWAGRDKIYTTERTCSKEIFIGIFYIVLIQKFQFLMIILGTGSRFHLRLAQLRCWRKFS